MRLLPSLHRLGDRQVGVYLLEEAGRVTIVDAGVPGYYAQLAADDALLVGDAFCTLAVTTGATGPRLAPFTADPELALASLERLAGVEAGWVLPGHGEAWTAGVEAALTAVRAAGVAHLAQPHASGGQAG